MPKTMLFRATKNAAIYFCAAELFYLSLDVLPELIAFYFSMLFFLVHIVGGSLVGLCSYYFQFSAESLSHFVLSLLLVAMNSGIVFTITIVKGNK